MAKRQQLLWLLLGVFSSLGASYRTPNFLVEAPTPIVAQRVAEWAEYYRKQKAVLWLGREMPPWPQPCPVSVKVTAGGAGGATTFDFDGGRISQAMSIEGSLDRLLASVLPHEVTHTVFAYYFGCPVPRWADEGGAVLSEDDLERSRHDMMVRQILGVGRGIPLTRLFTLRHYPADMRDVGTLYAEGYSVSDYLVSLGNRPTFLAFVAHGMQYGWDSAVQTHYHFQSVDQLQQAWIDYLKQGKRQPPAQLASNDTSASVEPAKRIIVRLTAPPVQPMSETPMPIIRAQSPDAEQSGGWWELPQRQGASRPGYLPDYDPDPACASSASGHAQPPPAPPPGDRRPSTQSVADQSPGARLGPPQFGPAASPFPRGTPAPVSPAGYPY